MAGGGARLRAAAALAGLLALLPVGGGPRGAQQGEPGPAFERAAPALRGRAEVSDGDTLRIGAVRVRLFGIDAPERTQTCDGGAKGAWPCGAAAALRLRELIGEAPVSCRARDRDRYGRLVATCTVAGVDLADRLVAEGLARAYTRFGDDYARIERKAKTEQIGLWRGSSAAPWDYRAESRPAESEPPSANCRIKGNVTTSGARVYHRPGGRFYDRTRIDPRRGEAWFCDAAAAEAAGFRAARN